MVKKLGIIAFVMLLMVALALPVYAISIEGDKGERFTVGGTAAFDIGFYKTDQDTNTVAWPNGVNNTNGWNNNIVPPTRIGVSRTQLIAASPYWDTLFFKVDMGPASLFARFFTCADFANNIHSLNINGITTAQGTSNSSGGYGPTYSQSQQYQVGLDVIYGSYKFGNCIISAGKMEGSTFTLAMSQAFGYVPGVLQAGHVAGVGFGAIYCDEMAPQIRFEQHINKMFSYQISLAQPGTYDAFGAGLNANQAQPIYNQNSYASWPALAIKLKFIFGPVMLFPAGMVQQVHWDNLPVGWDKSMVSWLTRLPVLVGFGPFMGMFEVAYGQNLAGSTGFGESSWSGFFRNKAGQILNSNTFAYWADLAYTVGMFTPHIYAGQDNSIPDSSVYKYGEKYNTRSILGANCYIKISKNFTIIPEIYASDLGYACGFPNPHYPAPYNQKLGIGQDVVGGLEFKFQF